jgi:ketosteroid isomerase-like protein
MHPNAEVVHKSVEYFKAGNIPGLLEVFAKDLVVHVPPGHQLSGEYRGRQQFIERFIGRVMELTEGVQLESHEVLASDDHAVGLYTIRAERKGTVYEWRHVNVYHDSGGQITEIWWTPFDQQTVADLFA